MAICNILGELKNPNGNFLTFSQYLEDLSKWNIKSTDYRLVPSKFIALEISQNDTINNISISQDLTEQFENACALFRNDDNGLTPNEFKNLFWQNIENIFLINENNIHYMGDINIQSYNELDGMGYSEIYCHIPNEAKKGSYQIIKEELNEKRSINSQSFLEGYEDYKIQNPFEYTINYSTYSFELDKINNDPFFNINSIIVLYDIYGNGEKIYDNIPLGIYFTGLIENGLITNSITKYVPVEMDDAFGAGTSYGLRICSKFIAEQQTVSTQIIQDEPYSDLTQVLSQLSISQNKMDEIINKTYKTDQNYKNLLSIFKNSRTNVPYIKNVNGINYWFINGRIIDKVSLNTDQICEKYTLNAYIIDQDNNRIDTTSIQSSGNYKIVWEFLDGEFSIIPDELYINGESHPILNTITITPDTSSQKLYEYEVKVKYNGDIFITKVFLFITYPSYIGLLNDDEINDINIHLMSLDSFYLPNQFIEYKYSNNSLKHICYLYPNQPKYYHQLISIEDAREIEYINDFECKEIQIGNQSYLLYFDKHPADVINYTLKFK